MAICDLTITYERRTAVDFTMPFMTLGKTLDVNIEMTLTITLRNRNQHSIRQTDQTATRLIFFPLAAFVRCVDVHGISISGCVVVFIHFSKVIVKMLCVPTTTTKKILSFSLDTERRQTIGKIHIPAKKNPKRWRIRGRY